MDTIRKFFCSLLIFHMAKLLFILFIFFTTYQAAYGDEKRNIESSSATTGKEAVEASKGIYTSDPGLDEKDRILYQPYDFSALPPERNECDFGYEKSGITLNIRASIALNVYSNRPSTLIVELFQFTDLNYMRDVANKSDGIYALLSDPSDKSILTHRRIIIQPGVKETLTMDRVDGTKYLCVVAGYWKVDPSKCIKVYPIPIRDNYKFWLWKKGCAATKLAVDLLFDSHSIQ